MRFALRDSVVGSFDETNNKVGWEKPSKS